MIRFFVTAAVFAGCLGLGFWIAWHKPLWNDEYYSQTASVQGLSFSEQLAGRIPEGGNAPLFYATQKLFLQGIGYRTPAPWLDGHWTSDKDSQILLRITPVVFMSLSVSLVFYYFLSRYSWPTAFYSLALFLSSYMLWAYWAEARPYALWVFLTAVQSLVFLNGIDPGRRPGDRLWVWLAAINILLSLTSILSLGQTAGVSLLWWSFKERDWKKYLVVTLLPAAIALFYYAHAPKYQFFFGLSPEQLIRDNISRQRFDILFLFLIFLSVYVVGQKRQGQYLQGEAILKAVPYAIFMGLQLAASGAVIYLLGRHAQETQGFPITSRYFIDLTPVGVMATAIFSVALVKSLSRWRLAQVMAIGLTGFLFIQNFLKIVPGALHSLMR